MSESERYQPKPKEWACWHYRNGLAEGDPDNWQYVELEAGGQRWVVSDTVVEIQQ